eukprot:TRINITY_DN77980_c0_g1_i1.p1 TRINITY_DN77980_c0_g1~~TRINITY_DN77980_c0_g1_i1.p1  ORF type:complete len:312 (-),score=45.65 TRINITY_DN77980_c0_g1_i1:8-943(-)
MAAESLANLREDPESIPAQLRPSFFFDLDKYPFDHADLLRNATDVIQPLQNIRKYVQSWLGEHAPDVEFAGQNLKCLLDTRCKFVGSQEAAFIGSATPLESGRIQPDVIVAPFSDESSPRCVCFGSNVVVQGGCFDISDGGIYLGEGCVVEPGVTIKGPAIFGKRCTLRMGAYIRGDVVFGNDCIVRCEVKNSIVMDRTELCHPGYVGDSILGFQSHFGCQALTANLGLHGSSVCISIGEQKVDLCRRKVGAVLGDFSQLGCNSVSEPGCFLGPNTIVYPLTRLCKGVYGPKELIKNKPMENGVIERVVLQ